MVNSGRARVWQVLAYGFAVAAIAVGIAGLVMLASLSESTAVVVRTMIFGVVPALTVLALGSLASFRRPANDVWPSVALALVGVGFVTAAHQSWYRDIDSEQPDSGVTAVLFGAAMLTLGTAIAVVLTGYLRRTRLSIGTAVASSFALGIVIAGALVISLATPSASLLLAIGTLITIVVVSRASGGPEVGAERQAE